MFSSPVDGGSTLPTMAWQVQLLDRDLKTRSHRHNSTSYYHVFEGEGCTVIRRRAASNGAREISSACRRGRGTTTRTPTVTTPSSSQSMIGRP